MRLFAVDGGGADAMTGTAMVTVHVTDVNDNRPRFSKPLYEVLVVENTPVRGTARGEHACMRS